MATASQLLTVEEYLRLPEDSGEVYHELRQGEVVAVTRPNFRHRSIQKKLRRLLESAASPQISIDSEVPFRPVPEHELRVADVAVVTAEREAAIDPNGQLMGAPDLVIEVLSPSKTVTEISDKETLCLENGAREFWVVDPFRRLVKVSKPEPAVIAVDDIFS